MAKQSGIIKLEGLVPQANCSGWPSETSCKIHRTAKWSAD